MPYTPEHRRPAESPDQLRERIPGWGVDSDPTNRPAVPRERFDLEATGAHWDFPDRQEEKWPRERSVEHQFLTPVFGTVCPPSGLSGVIRRFAYRYSEARAAHWMLLLYADRVNALESHLASFATARPDNPITETGIRTEFTHHGVRSRVGRNRADLTHLWIDPIIVAGPWIMASATVLAVSKVLLRSLPRASAATAGRKSVTMQ